MEVARQFMESMVQATDDLQMQLDLIASQLGQTESLVARVKAACQVGSPATPKVLPKLQFKKPMMTPPAAASKRMQIDFDAFPSTPTLEQLGLSGQALALVGNESVPRAAVASFSSDLSEPRLRAPMSSSSVTNPMSSIVNNSPSSNMFSEMQ